MVRFFVMILSVLALVVILGGCVKKQSGHPAYASIGDVYAKYDADHNGVITKQEFVSKWQDKQKAETAWKKIDVKNNGFVSRDLNNYAPLSVWNDVESQNTPY